METWPAVGHGLLLYELTAHVLETWTVGWPYPGLVFLPEVGGNVCQSDCVSVLLSNLGERQTSCFCLWTDRCSRIVFCPVTCSSPGVCL